jgi:hypothetical protein
VRAELTISHRAGGLIGSLQEAFGAHEEEALQASALATKSPSSTSAITYAARGPGLVVMAWPTPRRTYLFVESSEGRLRKAAEDVWRVIHSNAPGLKPKLNSLVLLDEGSNDEIALATVGLRDNVRRAEIMGPIAIGLATALVVAVAVGGFDASASLAIGSIPAFVAAILALAWLAIDVRSRKLVWH